MKAILLALSFLAASQALGNEAILDSLLQNAEVDARFLTSSADELESLCARNPRGLSESECIATIRARQAPCSDQTVAAYPGRITSNQQMDVVIRHFVACLLPTS